MKKTILASALFLAVSAQAQAQATSCDDLVWSAQVLAANPDIGLSCQDVYERDGTLYAQVTIEVTRVRGNRITFKPLHTDGTMGSSRSINVSNTWRADIGGNKYRARDLLPGQQLNVYVPEDRFALAVDDGAFDGDEELLSIEEAAVVAMPKTASPLFVLIAAGLGLLGMGGLLTRRRRSA